MVRSATPKIVAMLCEAAELGVTDGALGVTDGALVSSEQVFTFSENLKFEPFLIVFSNFVLKQRVMSPPEYSKITTLETVFSISRTPPVIF